MEAAKVKSQILIKRIACKTIRRRLKEHKIDKLKVVFSSEIQDEIV
jgi:hypothetical protein